MNFLFSTDDFDSVRVHHDKEKLQPDLGDRFGAAPNPKQSQKGSEFEKEVHPNFKDNPNDKLSDYKFTKFDPDNADYQDDILNNDRRGNDPDFDKDDDPDSEDDHGNFDLDYNDDDDDPEPDYFDPEPEY